MLGHVRLRPVCLAILSHPVVVNGREFANPGPSSAQSRPANGGLGMQLAAIIFLDDVLRTRLYDQRVLGRRI
jgi:hypothetical protein